MFYVYVYYHPITKIPFYVGKGKEHRDTYHIRNRQNHYNKDMRNILLEIDALGQQPIIEHVVKNVDENTAYAVEQQLIQKYGRIDLSTGTLCNKTPGGEGFGRAGREWSAEERQKHLAHNKQNPRGKGYTQYTMEGQILAKFNSAADMSNAGFSKTQIMAIRRCCNGLRFSASGYRWSYTGHPLPEYNSTHKEVTQLTKQGECIATYASVSRAAKATGINQGDIASVARGNTRMKSAGGFIWRYS